MYLVIHPKLHRIQEGIGLVGGKVMVPPSERKIPLCPVIGGSPGNKRKKGESKNESCIMVWTKRRQD